MKNVLTISLVLFTNLFHGQQKLKAANEMFNRMAYIEAAKLYEEYLEKNPKLTTQTITNIADTYYKLNDMQKAVRWLEKLYNIQGNQLPDLYVLRYTQALRSAKDYDKANKIDREIIAKKKDKAKLQLFIANQRHLDSLSQKKSLFEINNLEINSKYSDFGATFYGDKLVYSSSKEIATIDKKKYSWNNQSYLTLYVAERTQTDGNLSNEKLFLPEITSKYHDATITFSNDLQTFYYTTNTLKGTKLKNNKKGTNNFQIIKSTINSGKITKKEKLSFNSLEYSVGHPSLSPNGKWLFFVSDMPGGYGETDIYMVELFANGSMSTPKNLGPKINTIGREMFPYFNNEKLYFSSEGHFGFGGLDIFESNFNGSEFSYPKNIGEPINSNKDDFSFIVDSTSKFGYFSSNRDSGKGDDDIYYFTKKETECTQYINGIVVNSKSKKPIDNVSIKVFNSFGNLKKEYFSDTNGKFDFEINCNENFRLMALKANYSSQEKEIKTSNKHDETTSVNFELANLGDFLVKDNENEKIDINTIFFEYNKWDITPQAAIELDKVVYILQNFPKVRIRIESHTDSKGDDLYNLKLSDNRAKSTQKYILSKGIHPDKIESAVGFGEMRLKNKCKNNVNCNEDEHYINRRSDFIIVEK